MRLQKRKKIRDFQIEILEGRKNYLVQAMEFRRRMLEEKQKPRDSRRKKAY